ncbi:uncharacterized protein LOC116610889 [Nematostella vectensis]|uniref:uncharacterized protein LOC116610889 n=1 Tax=Nematostella vectensis TaxID=45351 RepID=UPI0020777B1D|nr:uncharacterized protein LOC116610889 [Nematostella vectensis]
MSNSSATSRFVPYIGKRIMSSIEEQAKQLLVYKTGDMLGLDMFGDAEEGEMEGFKSRIAVFGMTGSGKSALINTVHKLLFGPEHELAVVQSSGGEGTEVLEEFFHDLGFTMVDTRGFFEFDTATEQAELFRIFYGGVKEGEVIDRGALGARKAASVGKAGHKMNKPPLSRQVHAVLWVIKANDVRLANEMYRDKFKFLKDRLSQESITIITAITHSDVIDAANNPEKAAAEVVAKAREATGSQQMNTFLISNWLGGQKSYDVSMQKEVMRLMETALECAERSVKMRQTKRSFARRQTERRAAQIRAQGGKMPREHEDSSDINCNF